MEVSFASPRPDPVAARANTERTQAFNADREPPTPQFNAENVQQQNQPRPTTNLQGQVIGGTLNVRA